MWINIAGWWLKKHLEKYEFVNGKDYPILGKVNQMFETTKPEMLGCCDNEQQNIEYMDLT